MKCPSCDYMDGWNSSVIKNVKGDNGVFYRLPIDLERDDLSYNIERESVYGCPKCGNVFMDV